jgi:hypothetical protein
MPSSIIGTGRGLQPAAVGYGEKTDTATAYGGMTLWWEREGGGGRKIGQGGVGRGGAVGGGGVGVMARGRQAAGRFERLFQHDLIFLLDEWRRL